MAPARQTPVNVPGFLLFAHKIPFLERLLFEVASAAIILAPGTIN
jgi:hypothetical protein